MKYTDKLYIQTLEIKQSKFISHLLPYDLYEKTLYELKESHPKARHFVVSYRYLNEFKQIVEHSSDDGEPKGTSGKPTLMVLQGSQMINTAIITVRYFGGTKLGTGGLVRAYSDAANLVLETADVFEYKEEIHIRIVFEYANIRKIEYECLMNKIEIIQKDFSDTTQYLLKSDEKNMQTFLGKMDRLISII
ncbi:MAG: YigZ family protein [Helicobacteraceae bacterium]|nr:YigZ family protein [Candidatus Sulfurimonas ponti]MBL6973116.1 YigZ family protein [Sulfurimonas sp.]